MKADLLSLRAALERAGSATSDFDLNPDFVLPPNRVLRAASVLVPIIDGAKGLDVILTKRSSRLRHHPGQIAFPGGRQDETDADAVEAALREAEEEIGLPRHRVRIIGTLPQHETVTGYQMTPIVGEITDDFEIVPEPGEVEEVFRVPLAHLLDLGSYRVEWRFLRGQQRKYYVVPWGPYYIWGATARVLRALAARME